MGIGETGINSRELERRELTHGNWSDRNWFCTSLQHVTAQRARAKP